MNCTNERCGAVRTGAVLNPRGYLALHEHGVGDGGHRHTEHEDDLQHAEEDELDRGVEIV
jgi:hypothetical protein